MTEINKLFLEKVIIKNIINDSSFLARIANVLKPNLFSEDEYNKVALFYKNFWEKFNKIPSNDELKIYINNVDLLRAFEKVLNDTINIDINSIEKNILYSNAEKFVKERLAVKTLYSVIDNYKNGEIDPSELVSKFEQIAGISFLFDSGYNLYTDVDRYISSQEGANKRISTGFSSIDKNIGGGVLADGKCLAIVTAPTNTGKSIMLGNLAVNAAKQGKNVLIITLEMSEEVYAGRLYSALYNISINSLPLRGEELKEKISKAKYGSIIIKEFPPASMSVAQLDSYINDLYKVGNKFDLICVDYLTLLAAPGIDSSNEAGKSITRKLRALTYKYSLPIWTACQINREGMGETSPDLKHIAESIAIAAEADLIISLHQQPEDREMNDMRVTFLKSRFGPNGITFKLYFNQEFLRFEENTAQSENIEVPSTKNNDMILLEYIKDNEDDN